MTSTTKLLQNMLNQHFGPQQVAKPVKVFIIVEAGRVTDVYSDSNKVEVEIIDLDSQDESRELAKQRADEVQAQYVRVD